MELKEHIKSQNQLVLPLATVLETGNHIAHLAFETHGSYHAVAQPGQDLVRFSAFSNDRRLPRGGPIAAGTYFTSPLDAASVETGLSAAARDALPNPAPAIFRFDISIEPNPSRSLAARSLPASISPGAASKSN